MDEIEGEFDFDEPPYFFGICARNVVAGKRGWLFRLYHVVIDALRAGDEVPPEVTLLLLETMDAPDSTLAQLQKHQLLDHIELLQLAMGARKNGESKSVSFRAAVFEAHRLLKTYDPKELNAEAKRFIELDAEEAWEIMKKRKAPIKPRKRGKTKTPM